MKMNMSNVLTIIGFILLGVVNHYQLKFKVVEIESMVKVNAVQVKLYIKDEIKELKKELRINGYTRN